MPEMWRRVAVMRTALCGLEMEFVLGNRFEYP